YPPPAEILALPIRTGYAIITPAAGADAPQVSAQLTDNVALAPQFAQYVPIRASTTTASMSTRYTFQTVAGPGLVAGIAIANPGDSINTITATLKTEQGVQVGNPAMLTIEGNRQIARFISE